MKTRDEKLRADRLVFYAQDVERLDSELDAFLELCGARCALLIDKEGHLVTRRGEPLTSSVESIAALIAGSFAATKEMARQLGEEEFSILFHQGARDSIQLQLVGDRTLLAVLFDQRTNLGLVRFYAQETGRQLAEIFTDMAARPPQEGSGLSKDFSQDASDALDKLF
ncbi:MAG TPA: roadblock/LC7 domain-containing protein [Planctomycetota bacterium]|nr:roadblock/LC7 domain-containing protein [Planctomycetota bacterium]